MLHAPLCDRQAAPRGMCPALFVIEVDDCFGIDQTVRTASLAPHLDPYNVPEVSEAFPCLQLLQGRRDDSISDVVVNCREWHQSMMNFNSFTLVIEFHHNSFIFE